MERQLDSLSAPLTQDEWEVLGLICAGMGNREIARRLGVSESTVKRRVTSILRKLHVRTRVEAARVAFRSGLFDLSEVLREGEVSPPSRGP